MGTMSRIAALTRNLAALALAAGALAGCAATSAPDAAPTSSTAPTEAASAASPSPVPTWAYLTELPEWARESGPWIVYPEGFECAGTEGCPNDYRASFGLPGPTLPEGAEYYDPVKHSYVTPAE